MTATEAVVSTAPDRNLPPGPWLDEPDRVLWVDPETGLDCLARRGPLGAWCGYVGVPHTHPWHGLHTMVCLEECDDGDDGYCSHYEHHLGEQIKVHGDLNYAAPCDGDTEAGVCHIARPGEPDDVWWFGFDCAHAHDLWPGMPESIAVHATYRTLEYVQAEITHLAAQLKEVA